MRKYIIYFIPFFLIALLSYWYNDAASVPSAADVSSAVKRELPVVTTLHLMLGGQLVLGLTVMCQSASSLRALNLQRQLPANQYMLKG